MSLAKVTEGGAAFHNHTYQKTTARILQWIVDDARLERLRLVDEDGRPGTFDEILERARNAGGYFDVGGMAPATALELNTYYGLILFSTLDQLNEWGGPRGDEFYIDSPEQADAPVTEDDESFARLFDPVKCEQLEKMFPDGGQWTKYAERAGRNGLNAARTERGKFNPYLAAVWWLNDQGPPGWDLARCSRVLAKNLPERSRDSKHLLTGGID